MIALIGIGGGSQYKGPCSKDLQQVPSNHHVGHGFCENLQPFENLNKDCDLGMKPSYRENLTCAH